MGWNGTSFAFGCPSLVMTTSCPADACSSRLDNWSFAARTLIRIGPGGTKSAAAFSATDDPALAGGYWNAFLFMRPMWPHAATLSTAFPIHVSLRRHLGFGVAHSFAPCLRRRSAIPCAPGLGMCSLGGAFGLI